MRASRKAAPLPVVVLDLDNFKFFSDVYGHAHDLYDTQELNHPPIIKAIADTGYDGYVGHEFIPKGDPVAALEAAYRIGWGVG